MDRNKRHLDMFYQDFTKVLEKTLVKSVDINKVTRYYLYKVTKKTILKYGG